MRANTEEENPAIANIFLFAFIIQASILLLILNHMLNNEIDEPKNNNNSRRMARLQTI